jgi:hypothetical protein
MQYTVALARRMNRRTREGNITKLKLQKLLKVRNAPLLT